MGVPGGVDQGFVNQQEQIRDQQVGDRQRLRLGRHGHRNAPLTADSIGELVEAAAQVDGRAGVRRPPGTELMDEEPQVVLTRGDDPLYL